MQRRNELENIVRLRCPERPAGKSPPRTARRLLHEFGPDLPKDSALALVPLVDNKDRAAILTVILAEIHRPRGRCCFFPTPSRWALL